jgi:hypothetical protein
MVIRTYALCAEREKTTCQLRISSTYHFTTCFVSKRSLFLHARSANDLTSAIAAIHTIPVMDKELITLSLLRLRQSVASWPLHYEGEALSGGDGLADVDVMGIETTLTSKGLSQLVQAIASASCLQQWAARCPATMASWDPLVQSYEDFLLEHPLAEPYLRLARPNLESVQLRVLGYLVAQAEFSAAS